MSQIFVGCCAIVEKEGKFVLVQETKQKAFGKLNIPSGGLEIDESIIDGTVRETYEETGLTVEPLYLVGIYERPRTGEDKNVVNFVFACKLISGEPTPSEEHPVVEFYSYEDIKAFTSKGRMRSPWIPKAIQDYLDGKRLPLETIQVIWGDDPQLKD